MQIECRTTVAAAQVLFALTDAHMRPGREFRIIGPRSPNPPIWFTLSVQIPAHVVRQLQRIPDVIIAREHSA